MTHRFVKTGDTICEIGQEGSEFYIIL